ncbi:hypothetical protein OESDEN_04773, partial [Oesophagostomum dentatum]
MECSISEAALEISNEDTEVMIQEARNPPSALVTENPQPAEQQTPSEGCSNAAENLFMQEPSIRDSWAEEMNHTSPLQEPCKTISVKQPKRNPKKVVAATSKPSLSKSAQKSAHKQGKSTHADQCSTLPDQEVLTVDMQDCTTAQTTQTLVKPKKVCSSWAEFKAKKAAIAEKTQEEEEQNALIRDMSSLEVSSGKSTAMDISSKESATGTPTNITSSPSNVITLPMVTLTSTYKVDGRSVEELTATQLQQVVAYLDHDFYTFLRERANLAVFVAQTNPIEAGYAVIAAWIDELTHGIVAVNIERDKIYESIFPILAEGSESRELVLALKSRNVSQQLIREMLSSSATAVAFAHRYVRTLQTYQLTKALTKEELSQLDDDYFRGSRAERMTHPFPEKDKLEKHLELWRATFRGQLGTEAAKARVHASMEQQHRNVDASSRNTQPTENQNPQHDHVDDENSAPVVKTHIHRSKSTKNSNANTNPHSKQSTEPQKPQDSQHNDDGNESITHSQAHVVLRPDDQHAYGSENERNIDRAHPRRLRQESASPSRPQKRRRSPDPLDSPPKKRANDTPNNYSGCIFCSARTHYSAACPVVFKLSQRREILFAESRCHLCLKRHLGVCTRYKPCKICGERTHHPAFCVQNRDILEIDVREPRQRFYATLVNK